MKKCPFCAEEIQEDAVKCRFCGEWLNVEGEELAENVPEEVPKQRTSDIAPKRLPRLNILSIGQRWFGLLVSATICVILLANESAVIAIVVLAVGVWLFIWGGSEKIGHQLFYLILPVISVSIAGLLTSGLYWLAYSRSGKAGTPISTGIYPRRYWFSDYLEETALYFYGTIAILSIAFSYYSLKIIPKIRTRFTSKSE